MKAKMTLPPTIAFRQPSRRGAMMQSLAAFVGKKFFIRYLNNILLLILDYYFKNQLYKGDQLASENIYNI